MAGYQLGVSPTQNGLGAVVTVRPNQDNPVRSFDFTSTTAGDRIAILQSQDGFVTDSALVGFMTSGDEVLSKPSIATSYRTLRVLVGDPAHPNSCGCWVGDMVATGGGGGGGGTGNGGAPLIFQPGGPGGAPNVFTDWATLYGSTSPGATVIIDDSFAGGAAVIPTGSYPNVRALEGMDSNTSGTLASGQVQCVWNDGVQFPGLDSISNNLACLAVATATTPITLAGSRFFRVSGNSGLLRQGAVGVPVVILQTNGIANTPSIVVDFFSQIGSGHNDIAIDPLSGGPQSSVSVALSRGSRLSSGTITAIGPNAAQSNLQVVYLDQASALFSHTLVFAAVGTFSAVNASGYGSDTFRALATPAPFNAAQVLGQGGNATTFAAADTNNPAVGSNPTETTFIEGFTIRGTGSGLVDAVHTTFQLYKNGAPLAGVLLNVDTSGATFAAVIEFNDWATAPNGDYYTVLATPAAPIAPGLTNIVGGLQ